MNYSHKLIHSLSKYVLMSTIYARLISQTQNKTLAFKEHSSRGDRHSGKQYKRISDCIKCTVQNKKAEAKLFSLGWPGKGLPSQGTAEQCWKVLRSQISKGLGKMFQVEGTMEPWRGEAWCA